ncbi:Dynein heavy chain 9 [Phytophthora citrophthora]|uniref:Dynein heavy chain 9 n=1 Tax=Phytophthora citrophthora TaxID=4793 RepID=A0AAD9G185_9STRA|nr:Dynein heavy chain 9 [Phytophthora citrophthora]
MDGHLKRHLRTRRSSIDRTLSPCAPTFGSIATGTALRTREQARRELLDASERENVTNSIAHEESSTDMAVNEYERVIASEDTGSGDEGDTYPNIFEQSRMYMDEDQMLELRRKPPVAFVVRNAGKEEELQAAKTTVETTARPSRRGQSWHSPVHVPLSHRKLVQPLEIFKADPPFRPIAPRAPTVAKTRWREKRGAASSKMMQKPPKLMPMQTLEASDQLSHSAFVDKLRRKNKELFDRLVQRFAALRRVSIEEQSGQYDPETSTDNTKFSGVENAILFFLDAKHKHDVLYFKRKNAKGTRSNTAKLSLGLSSVPTTTGKYLPYDLERVDEAPQAGAGDYFMMTSTSLVHHTNNNDNDVSGEVIPLSQWIMESKMFSLLLAGIPLFQKFLVRKVFMGWIHAVRLTIYRENCKRIAHCLPFARQSFVRPLLRSCPVLRDIQEIGSLTLPGTRPAVDLTTVQEHQKEQLVTAEMKLIDAKEKLLTLMEEMVQQIFDDLEPPTNLDELYSAEASSVRMINAKWKSAPITAMRRRKGDIQRQKDTATVDMALLDTYIRMVDYMFTESLYLMIIRCVQHLRDELSTEENFGAICAAVTIVGDSLELAPSLEQTKHVFLDGLARLIRLVSNFHFTKNAITWSNNRGTGVLAVVSGSFEASDFFSAEFDLQSVLRKDPTFDQVTRELISELALWFERAAQQMLAFESLRLVYVEVQSVRKCTVPRENQNQLYPTTELSKLTGISGGELSRFLKYLAQRLNILDKSQHSCQKLQSSWKVGFLEIQCRHSISEILDLIFQERNSLHQTLYQLAVEGVTECVNALQRATIILEDRPQLIEFFCEQMKQVRMLKDSEKQLNQNIRNVDETVRALKRFAPPLGSEVSPQYNVMHQFLGKYTALVQSHAKFASKVLPNITYQVNTVLQKYSLRCQKLLKMYDDFCDLEEEEDMEKNVGTFQEVVKELTAIEKATKLYQEYQKMVGLKVVEIPSLAEAMTKWGEVQELVTFTLGWLAAINSMENGIFSEQNWEVHAEKVHSFLPVIKELQSRERAGFAEKMLGNIHQNVIDYLRKLSLVKEMAQPWVKIHHWKEILKLMDILNYVSSIGVLITDGYTVTLGFLRSRELWKFELPIREITQKAHHDAVTEKKLNAMKARLQDAMLPIIRVHDSYELDLSRASHLLELFEDDLLTIQSLAQVTASGGLQLQLVQWRDEVRHCEEVLDKWSVVQRSRTKLSLLFSLRDVQHSVTEASFEFQAIDRKWRGMMHAAKGTSSLSICLREVVTTGFLIGAQDSYAKLWLQLGTYLDEKRKYFPRFHFLSDHDLFQLLIYARDPSHLSRMVSKCFRGINSLRLVRSSRSELVINPSTASLESNSSGAEENNPKEDEFGYDNLHGIDIGGVCGIAFGEELPIKPLRVSANPQFWMKELDERVRNAMVEAVNCAMDGSLVTLFEDNLESLIKPAKKRISSERSGSESIDNPFPTPEITSPQAREWKDYPLQVVILCVHILMTHELSPLARLDRTGAAWQRFWHLFQLKKSNLVQYIGKRSASPRERWIASSILTLLLNESQGIRELYEDQPLMLVSQSAGAAAHQTGSDVSVYHYSYAAGDSFSWIKLPRFYYDPFERKCTVHHLVKTFQYEYSFLGRYACPVLTPICNKTLLAMSTALSLEHGLVLHSPANGGCTRKRTLVKELSAMVGRECLEFDYSNGLTLTHFKGILRGVLQSNSVWLSFSGLQISNMLRVFIQEMNQIVDALRAHQDALVLDGAPVDITNNELAILVTCSFDYELPRHQHVFLCLPSSFAPVFCSTVDSELVVEALLLVNGFQDWKQLSRKLEALFCLLLDDSMPFIKDFHLIRLSLASCIVRNATSRLDSNSWQTAEKSLVAAVWDEIHSKVLPDRRVAFLNCIRSIFPHAVDLEINPFGILALRTSCSVDPPKETSVIAEDDAVSYESDEEEEPNDLKSVKMKLESAISALKLSVSEFYIRKLLELYQILSKNVAVAVVGRGVCGKSTAISVLSAVMADSDNGESDDVGLGKQIRTVRLYPETFSMKEIYGEATGDATWDDGFFSHFFRQNCVDAASIEANLDANSPHLTRKGSFYVPPGDQLASKRRSLSPAAWFVFDGVQDATTLLEPLRDLMELTPTDTKKLVLPNGDQLECTQDTLRVFCEVETLENWSPACLSHCGLVYMQTEHMVPYTLLIKSWLQQQQPKRKRSSLAHLTNRLEPTSEFVAKLMRAHLPSILDIFKRNYPSFLDCSVTHGVSNMLQILTPFVSEIAKGVVEDDAEWMTDAKVIVAYAATLSLGMILPPRNRLEFHLAAVKIAPQLLEEHPIFTLDSSATLFDIGLKFQDHRVVLYLWSRSLQDQARPATRRSSFAYQSEVPRRTSAILKAKGRIMTTVDTEDEDEEFLGDTSTLTSPLSIIYVPTAVTVSCSVWLKMLGVAKANTFVVGESGVGKTLVMENSLRELGQKERVSATALQINALTTGFDIQRVIENGMTGKLKGVHCPGVGKRALVVLLENINLDKGPSCAMIRQVIDGKGSFIKTTKEYVEFRDLAVWCSFSVSSCGYPRVPSRLLRHFHMLYKIWLPDQSDQVFAQVVPMFTTYFRRRYEGVFGNLTSFIHRISQFPVQMFKSARKRWKPSAVAPHLLLNIGSILSVFISLMNVSVGRVPADPATEFELLTLFFTLQLHRNRFLDRLNLDQLQSLSLRTAKKLGFSAQSLGFLRSPEDFFFADCGDTEGITRTSAKALTTLFVAGEERFHWYHKTTLKVNTTDSSVPDPTPILSELNPKSSQSPRGKGIRSDRLLTDQSGSTPSTSAQQAAIIRRSSLAMVALKTGRPDEKITAIPSFYQLQNTLDMYSFLQSGVRHLLLNGSDTADRRSTTMVACGTLSFQFREICTELRLTDFIENVKGIVLEAGLKAIQTVLYVEFEDLNDEEVALLVYLIRQDDLPPHIYSSADKVKLHAVAQPPKGLPPASPVNRSSFLQEVTTTEKEKQKRTPVNCSAHVMAIFRENVRRSLYMVLSVGNTARLLEFMKSQPSVYYRFVLKTFPRWQDVSAEAVCNSALYEWASLSENTAISTTVREIMLLVHRTAEGFCSQLQSPSSICGRRFGAVTTQLDDMIRVFKVLFAFQHRKLENQLRDVEKALRFLAKRLSQTNLRVAKEETSEVAQNDASQAVVDTTTQLAAQESLEREARRLFLLDEERCAKIQSEIETERANIQRELSKTLPDVQEATEALSQINKYHIVEMKSFTNPPQLVRLAMQAVCVLLDAPPTWSEALRILADIHFLDRLRNFDKDSMDPSLIDRVKFYVNHPDFSMENMRRASLASTTLCKWVLAVVRYFEAMKRVAPTQKLLEETEKNYLVIEERAQAEKRKLVDIELHLAELRACHTHNLQREIELQRTQETRLRWKCSVTSFGHVIKQWYDATRERMGCIEKQRDNLLGDCAIAATLIIFGAEKSHEDREKLVSTCREAIQTHFASPSYPVAVNISTMLQYWVLSGEGLTIHLQKTIVDMKDEEDEAFSCSLFLMDQVQQVCFKIPFLVDPLDRGVSWIKQAYRSSNSCATPSKGASRSEFNRRDEPGAVVVVDAGDSSLLRSIETCLAQVPPSMILIENASEGDESTIQAALELIVMLKEKSSCAVYFAAKTLSKATSWTPKTWSYFAVVDFTPTRQDLENHVLTLLYQNLEEPVQSEIQSIQFKLSVEKTKEDHLFKNFLTNLCVASGQATSPAGLGSVAAIVSAWISPGAGNQGFYDQESMERISSQLGDFNSVRQNRKLLQENLQNLYSERRQALAFVRRARAFALTEEGMERLSPSLHLSLAHTLARIDESLADSLQKDSELQHTGIDNITMRTSALFIRQRLAGLPTSYHRTYMLILVLSIGEINRESDKIVKNTLVSGVRERILQLYSRGNFSHVSDKIVETDPSEAIKQTTRVFVHQIIAISLVSFTVPCKSRLEDELLDPFLKIQKGFLQFCDKKYSKEIEQALYHDMIENSSDWKRYLKEAACFDSPTEISSGRNPKFSVKSIPWPPWTEQNFTLLERLQIHFTLFDCIPLRLMDNLISSYFGEHEILALLEDGGIVRPSVDSLVKTTGFSTPLLILTDSKEITVDGSSIVRQCARRRGIPPEAVASLSIGLGSTLRHPGIWGYRDKTVNTLENDRVTRDITAVTKLKDVFMDPGWTIIEGASSLSIANALRLEIGRLSDVKSTSHKFHLWLVEDLPTGRDLNLIPAQRLFLEPPQTLQQHYENFLQSERERREAEKLKKLEKNQQKQENPSRPPPLSRHASSILTALQRSSTEHEHIQAALWLFHSIFRLHLTTARIPADIFISHCELDRATRLIQLHLHQRVLAATVTSGSSSKAQTSTPSSTAVVEAHGRTLMELVALIYTGRLHGDERAAQCRELLTCCLRSGSLDLHSGDQDLSLAARILQLRERLMTTTMASSSKLFERLEADLLPVGLQYQHCTYESSLVLKNLATIYNSSSIEDSTSGVAAIAEFLPIAQQHLEELMAVFPDKTSLLSSIQQLQKQKRESMVSSWGKKKSSRTEEFPVIQKNPTRHPPIRQGRVSTLRRQQYALTQLQQQPNAHLIQVELPAMASYLTFIWSKAEMFLSLRLESVELMDPDITEAVKALARGNLPSTWRGDARSTNGEGYSTPTRLDKWLRWFQQSVAFYHTHQQCVMALAPVRIDSVWLPALQRPKGSSLHHV